MPDELYGGTDLQVNKPHPARIYDYWLGGKDNYGPDREAAERGIRAAPDVPVAARENRAFLRRAVRMCAQGGIRQFIDIGAGLPTRGNVHEVAQGVAADARVVYVDNDPIVLAHGRALLADNATTTVVTADLREPKALLEDPRLRELIDYSRPVAILFCAVLHFVDDAQALAAVEAAREHMAPGSHLVLSHSTADHHEERAAEVAETWRDTDAGLRMRGLEQVREYFNGFELFDPGVVHVGNWRPEPDGGGCTRWLYGGVGRKV